MAYEGVTTQDLIIMSKNEVDKSSGTNQDILSELRRRVGAWNDQVARSFVQRGK